MKDFGYFIILFSPWLKKFLNFDHLLSSGMKELGYFLRVLSLSLMKFWILIISKAPEWRIWLSSKKYFHIFTMIEENFEFWASAKLRNERFWLFSKNIFTMVEEKIEFWLSEMLQNKRSNGTDGMISFVHLFTRFTGQKDWKITGLNRIFSVFQYVYRVSLLHLKFTGFYRITGRLGALISFT